MTLPPITPEFLLVAIAVGVGAATGAYLSARRNLRHVDYAFIVREVEGEDMDGSQLSLIDAIERKNDVLDDIADRSSGWLALAAAEMAKMEPGVTGIGEDYKRILRERGVPEPKHPNVVGAFIATMVRRGVLVPTGEYRAMREARSNGRKSAVYELKRPEAA